MAMKHIWRRLAGPDSSTSRHFRSFHLSGVARCFLRALGARVVGPLSVVTILALLRLALPASSGLAAGPTVQLCIAVDGSGSIATSDFSTEINGLADAIQDNSALPQNGSVELTVVQFGGVINTVQTVVAPTVINSPAAAVSAANSIRAMSQLYGFTPTDLAIDTCSQKITSSPNFTGATKHVINISTDGDPNSMPDTLTSRNNAVAAGITEVDLEAIGNDPTISNTLQIAWPRTGGQGYLAPPVSGPRFVIRVATYADYSSAIRQKLQQIIPQPATATLTNTAAPTPDGSSTPIPLSRYLYLPAIMKFYPSVSWSDDFSNPSSGWAVVDNGSSAWSYQSGEYEILQRNTNSFAWARAPIGSLYGNYWFSADMYRYSGANSGYGLIFDMTDSNSYFVFEVHPGAGQYRILQLGNSSWTTVLDWTASPKINTYTAKNHLLIEHNGVNVSFYINGTQVSAITQNAVPDGVGIGLLSSSYSTAPISVRYDNFQVAQTLANANSLSNNSLGYREGLSTSGVVPAPKAMNDQN